MSSSIRYLSSGPVLWTFLTLVPMGIGPLEAQADPDSVKLRNECRFAEQVLTLGQPATKRDEALSIIGSCGLEASPVIAAAWSSGDWDRQELELLVTSTRSIVTPQLVDALLSTLDDAGRSAETRIAALLVLITYVDPALVPGFDDFLGDPAELLVRSYVPVDHPFPAAGRDAIEPPSHRLGDLLRELEGSDPDSDVRVAARIALRNSPFR